MRIEGQEVKGSKRCSLVFVIEDVNVEGPGPHQTSGWIWWERLGGRDPGVELRQPILQSVHLWGGGGITDTTESSHPHLTPSAELRPGAYRHDGEHGVGLRVPEQDVDEGDDLQRLAEAHAVGQNTAEAAAAVEALHRLNQVVVQESDAADLARKSK